MIINDSEILLEPSTQTMGQGKINGLAECRESVQQQKNFNSPLFFPRASLETANIAILGDELRISAFLFLSLHLILPQTAMAGFYCNEDGQLRNSSGRKLTNSPRPWHTSCDEILKLYTKNGFYCDNDGVLRNPRGKKLPQLPEETSCLSFLQTQTHSDFYCDKEGAIRNNQGKALSVLSPPSVDCAETLLQITH